MSSTVLVVDDESAIRESLRTLLECAGLVVFDADCLEDALAAIAHIRFGLVLTDLSLRGAQGREGFEILDHVRRSGISTPVVLFTAHADDALRAEALHRGAADLWSKSLPVETLVERVLAS